MANNPEEEKLEIDNCMIEIGDLKVTVRFLIIEYKNIIKAVDPVAPFAEIQARNKAMIIRNFLKKKLL